MEERANRNNSLTVAIATPGQSIARCTEYGELHTPHWLKGNFTRPLRVDDLAEQARMSSWTFHHHFRSMTALSPWQYQKQLRPQEARRLMLAERLDAATAAFQVGDESPSQFSREYNCLLVAPPLGDSTQLRQISPV